MQIFDIVEELEKERKKNKELEEKISKAIEYIEKNKYLKLFSDITGPDEYNLEVNPVELLNILKGE